VNDHDLNAVAADLVAVIVLRPARIGDQADDEQRSGGDRAPESTTRLLLKESTDRRANVLLDLAILELRERRHAESRALFAESLELALGRGFRSSIGLALRGLAATAAADGRLEPAARLLGTAERIDEETGWPMHEYERAAFAEVAAAVGARADEPEIAAALEAGARMSDTDAIAYALAVAGEGAAV
jgi:hypothetical protein